MAVPSLESQSRHQQCDQKRAHEDPDNRESQQVPGWTLEYCMFLDNLKTVNIDCKGTWDERDRYQKQFVLRWKDDKNPGKMSIQDDSKKAARSLATGSHHEGTGNGYIPPSGRSRQRPIDEELRSQLRWQRQKWQHIYGSQASSSSSAAWWEPRQWQERQALQRRRPCGPSPLFKC